MWVEATETALSWDEQLYSLQGAEQSRNRRVVFCSERWCGKWFRFIFVLCTIFVYLLFAYSMIKSASVFRRNDAERLQSWQSELCGVLECFWANCYGVKGSFFFFFYCLKYFAYDIQWQRCPTAGGLWGSAQLPFTSTEEMTCFIVHFVLLFSGGTSLQIQLKTTTTT